ncbi:BMP family ABC transporter substrate-binding protein [Actinomyces sp. MRS3W]|uniref:BMP family lipoprotein n=1 Tax=Actinomyces sp. MRS3W TaxID=2800796 RepID=UPI0028FD795C|nr:BMP family ABC transporter substrate-binding protein [Actinomyces sp. MRS3W]MDU0349405.1 BMP family ABC transporter substrate-binding protein [Actinomyces sp. MRS3W]
MKKKYSAIALGLVAALSLAACGSAPDDSSSSSSGGAASDFTACMVSDEGGFDDQSFNQSGKEGLDRAEADLGVKTIAVESQSDADYPTNVDSLIQQNCNLIIGVGFNLAEHLTTAAQENPDIQFALIDSTFADAEGNPVELDNAKPLVFNTAEAAYLAGYVAAGTTQSGTVATYGGQAIPTVQIFMEGFAKGVAKYNEDNGTDVEVLGWDPDNPSSGSFVGNFSDTAKGQQLTEQFLSQGADIILPVAGPVGSGTLAALKEAGDENNAIIWVDADGYVKTESDGGSPYMLTSVVKGIDTAVYDAVQEASAGNFTSDPFIGTLANDGVSIAEFHDWFSKVPSDVREATDELKQQIIDGSLDVSTPYDPS